MPAPLSCRLLLTVWLPLAAAQANPLEDAAILFQKGNHADALAAVEPLLAVVPLHIFGMELASAKGLDVDQPRNLAKSVTVE